MVKITLVSSNSLAVAPRLGYCNHYGKGKLHTVHYKEFEGIIKHSRVGARGIYNGQNLIHIPLHNGAFHGLLTGKHSVHITPDSVNLTVVEYKAVGVCTLPAGGCIGRKAGVNEGYCTFKAFVKQIKIKSS